MTNRAVADGSLLGGVAGFVAIPSFAIAWIALGVFGLYKLFGGSVDHSLFRANFAAADERARAAELALFQHIGLTELYSVRDDLEKWVASYRHFDADLNRDLENLKSTSEARQRDAFLDRFPSGR